MSMAVVVDASVLVKWFVIEEGSEEALEIRDKYVSGEVRLIAPELLIFEVLNALYYKRLFSLEEMREVAEALDAYSFDLYPLKGDYAKKTLEIAYENNVTIYDASYLSLALIKGTLMYTADVKLWEKLKDKYSPYIKVLK
ncbi:MAG: type II toxin-antitoxin system VapC family toxin [Candidatus Nezhaarchaeales archaeon]